MFIAMLLWEQYNTRRTCTGFPLHASTRQCERSGGPLVCAICSMCANLDGSSNQTWIVSRLYAHHWQATLVSSQVNVCAVTSPAWKGPEAGTRIKRGVTTSVVSPTPLNAGLPAGSKWNGGLPGSVSLSSAQVGVQLPACNVVNTTLYVHRPGPAVGLPPSRATSTV